MSNPKTFLNLYWSVRRYVYSVLPLVPTYWNPTSRPASTDDKFLIVKFQDDYFGKMSYSYPRFFCVVKEDPEGIKLSELTSQVVEHFASEGSAVRYIPFYDYVSGLVIGEILIEDVNTRPVLPYAEGFIHRAIDMGLRYVVSQRHL